MIRRTDKIVKLIKKNETVVLSFSLYTTELNKIKINLDC